MGGDRRPAARGEARWGLGLGFQSSEARVAGERLRARAE